MSTLLIGRWTWAGHLEVTGSHQIEDGDTDAIRELIQGGDIGNLWAVEFPVDRHRDAVQRAHDEYVADEHGTRLIDEVEHYEPVTG
ncbi:hypothetical protein ACWIID_02300 [Streptomyces phaeochromogenes]|uniref:hypothetical protein n=1 Tax=unclassified Streptomyces TaxID=2593676 RepID=UPI003652AA44